MTNPPHAVQWGACLPSGRGWGGEKERAPLIHTTWSGTRKLYHFSMNLLPFSVYVLGAVSFLTDLSSEMIYPLLPVFLTTVVGAGAVQLGIIEGVAESTASILKIVSGIWTDKVNKRKPFLLFGYTLSGLTRPLIGLANVWPVVLLLRFFDRTGKGLRTSPRDALIADVVDPARRGRAYGLHRAMDHAGAVLGPLVAIALISGWNLSLRQIFLAAAIPAVLVVILLAAGLKEPTLKTPAPRKIFLDVKSFSRLPSRFRVLMGGILIFTLGNSTDAFFLLRLSDAQIPPQGVAFLWSMHHVVKMLATYYGGRMADKVNRLKLLIFGWVYYGLIYLAFGLVKEANGAIWIFLLYGIYFGLTEPTEKALVSDYAPEDLRGTAFGIYHGIIGLAAFPASLIFGIIWKVYGAPAAFGLGAFLAGLASLVLIAGLGKAGENKI